MAIVVSTTALLMAAEACAESAWTQWPAPCVTAVAREARISRSLLQAIAWVESRGRPWALHVNLGGRGWAIQPATEQEARRWLEWLMAKGHSVDIGLAQVNSRHLSRLRIEPHRLLEPCLNLRVGARILNELIARHGETWQAIMRYNGRNPGYAHRVREAWLAFRRMHGEGGR